MPLPAVPVPRTWAPGDLVFVPRVRADLADAVALLAQRPYFAAQASTGEAVGSASAVTMTLDTTLTDSWNGFADPASNVYTCQLPGWYVCDARVPFAYTGSTPVPLLAGFASSETNAGAIAWGAATANGSTSQAVTARCTDLIQMPFAGSGGTVTTVVVRQDSGSTVNLGASAVNLPTVSMRWVCATAGTQPLPVPPLTPAPSPITAAWLNANLRDAASFLIYPPAFRAHYTPGSSSLASSSLASPAIVPLTTSDLDNYGGLTTGASAHYTVPVAGRYFLAGQFNLNAASTATFYACGLRVNGSSVSWGNTGRFAGSGIVGGASVARRLRLNAGDTVQLVAAQSSGGSIAYSTSASNQTRFLAVWEGM